jgi:hypothetical protein
MPKRRRRKSVCYQFYFHWDQTLRSEILSMIERRQPCHWSKEHQLVVTLIQNQYLSHNIRGEFRDQQNFTFQDHTQGVRESQLLANAYLSGSIIHPFNYFQM